MAAGAAGQCDRTVFWRTLGVQNHEEAGRRTDHQHRQHIRTEAPAQHIAVQHQQVTRITGPTHSLALEGRDYGIAVSMLHPGNVMVERRADGKSTTGRDEGVEPMISTADVARAALLMATLPAEANLLEAIMLPLSQDYLGRG